MIEIDPRKYGVECFRGDDAELAAVNFGVRRQILANFDNITDDMPGDIVSSFLSTKGIFFWVTKHRVTEEITWRVFAGERANEMLADVSEALRNTPQAVVVEPTNKIVRSDNFGCN